MVVLLNIVACAGKAAQKWKTIENSVRSVVGNFDLLPAGENVKRAVKEAFDRGTRFFIAAGGDGTVNYLINALASQLSSSELQKAVVGAIGLGSSNDFHKPFNRREQLHGIPMRIRFENAINYDLGKLSIRTETHQHETYYWINNASAGITADANYLFNYPDRILSRLKRFSTDLAILYAAVKTIRIAKTIEGKMSIDNAEEIPMKISNLGVIKNPHFSGSFCYDSPFEPDSGSFYIHTCEETTRMETLRVLYRLSNKKFAGIKNTKSWKAMEAVLKAPAPFAVEFDGETVRTDQVHFSLIRNGIKVCP